MEWILTLPNPSDLAKSAENGDGDSDKIPAVEPLRQLTRWNEHYIRGRLDAQAGEEFWFKGAEGKDVMGWALKPRGWKPDQKAKYPLGVSLEFHLFLSGRTILINICTAFLIHGGPQSAWEDSWSTRWNPALFAAQGYFVVAINPTGSTGYGQEFTDAIQGDWGGSKSFTKRSTCKRVFY